MSGWKGVIYVYLMASILLSACLKQAESDRHHEIEINELRKAFVNPPDSTGPWVYWYWISDHISREGKYIDKKLPASAQVSSSFTKRTNNLWIRPFGFLPVKIN